MSISTHADKLSSLFMNIGRSAPHQEAIALVYPRSAKLRSYLAEYYIVVVNLCRYLFEFGQKSAVQQFASSLKVSYLETIQAGLERWASSIKEQMALNEVQESSQSRLLTKEMFKSATQQQIHALNMRVLDFCSTYDHERTWKQLRKVGNASFFEQHEQYKDWRDHSHPCTLLYTGKLGSGKSVLLANIVDDLSLLNAKERVLVAYFFCRHDVPESLKARTIVGSLARQLLCTITDLSLPAKSCQNLHIVGDIDKVLRLLLQGFSSPIKVYFVIDGLDECDSEDREGLLEALRVIQEKLEVRICISFREEPNSDLQSISSQLVSACLVPIPLDNPDIEAFIKADLERCLQKECLTLGDPRLKFEIQDALLEGSQGMFLWVALQMQSLCNMSTDYAIREALADLPKTLSETFARILQRSGRSNPELQRRTLDFVLAARRPLTTDELREALSVVPGDAIWDPSRMLNNVNSALACCGCLLVVDEEELTVHVVHHSVKQFIQNGLHNSKYMRSPVDEAQKILADTIVTYLCYGIFGTAISRAKVHRFMAQSVPSRIMQNASPSSDIVRQLAANMLESRPYVVDVSRALANARASVPSRPEHEYKFYAYAKTYWKDYILFVSGENASIVKLTEKLIFERAAELLEVDEDYWTYFQQAAKIGNGNIVALWFQAGRINPNTRDHHGWVPLCWAAWKGHKDAVEELLSIEKVDVEAKSSQGYTPLMLAAQNGHKDTVEVLLLLGQADVTAKDRNGYTSLIIAASLGHSDTVEVLLTVGKADIEAKGKGGWTALISAARSKHSDTVKVLLTLGYADVETRDEHEKTALMHAVTSTDKDTVSALLGIGKADVEARDQRGDTPLLLAARNGQTEIVEMLLNINAINVEVRNKSGATPLIEASSGGYTAIVRLLLEVGKADVEVVDRYTWTALIHAARYGRADTVKLLLELGNANIDVADELGTTALMEAERIKSVDTINVLRSHISRKRSRSRA